MRGARCRSCDAYRLVCYVNICTAFAIVAMAIAIAAWSCDPACDPRESRLAGIVVFIAAAVTVAVR